MRTSCTAEAVASRASTVRSPDVVVRPRRGGCSCSNHVGLRAHAGVALAHDDHREGMRRAAGRPRAGRRARRSGPRSGCASSTLHRRLPVDRARVGAAPRRRGAGRRPAAARPRSRAHWPQRCRGRAHGDRLSSTRASTTSTTSGTPARPAATPSSHSPSTSLLSIMASLPRAARRKPSPPRIRSSRPDAGSRAPPSRRRPPRHRPACGSSPGWRHVTGRMPDRA